MNFDKNINDVKAYLFTSNILPNNEDKPHCKICEECNFGELCLNYYLDKEVDV